MPGQDDGVDDPEAGGTLRTPTSEALQADHQAGASPHHQGGWSCSISWTTSESWITSRSSSTPGVQHGAEGDLHVEVDQPAPGEEADPAEVVYKEKARGANLGHVVQECNIIINDFQTDSKLWSSLS